MRVDWYGQAAFHLTGRDSSVFVDPIGDTSRLAARGIIFEYRFGTESLPGDARPLVVVPAVP